MFGGRQYYTLVASLSEYALGSAPKGFDANAVYGAVRRELSRADRRAAGLVWSLAGMYGLRRERVEQLYAMCAAERCGFLREWARFDRNLRNVVAAHTARAKGRAVADSLLTIEGDEIPLSLAKSTAGDFNLRGELDYADRLLAALGDEVGFVEKERAIDDIRWGKADAIAEGDTFGAPTILAYLVKVAIIGRWASLDPETGRAMYDRLVNSMNRYEGTR